MLEIEILINCRHQTILQEKMNKTITKPKLPKYKVDKTQKLHLDNDDPILEFNLGLNEIVVSTVLTTNKKTKEETAFHVSIDKSLIYEMAVQCAKSDREFVKEDQGKDKDKI